jgi:4-hydroxy-tetrahydrodipicolinate reductase
MAADALLIFGATGRMGQALLRAIREDPRFTVCGAVASVGSGRLGEDAALEGPPCGVRISAEYEPALKEAAVALEFSSSSAVGAHAQACAKARVPLLVGTTGLDAAASCELELAARDIPVLIAPNTSLGVAVLRQLVGIAAAALGSADVEIFEAHHRMKRDAPSGTALSLGEAVAHARGLDLRDVAVYDRQGASGERRADSIGFSVLRAGDIVGEHTVTFAAAGERLEITHRAADRMTFARGALQAAAWLVGRPAGLYGMEDVLRV